MEEFIAALGGWGNLTAALILAGVAIMIFTGKLVPARMVEFLIVERDNWKKIALTQIEVNKVLASSNETLTEVGKTTSKIVSSLPTSEEAEGEEAEDK